MSVKMLFLKFACKENSTYLFTKCTFAFIFQCNAHISKSNQQPMHRTKSPPNIFSFSIIHFTQIYVTIQMKNIITSVSS